MERGEQQRQHRLGHAGARRQRLDEGLEAVLPPELVDERGERGCSVRRPGPWGSAGSRPPGHRTRAARSGLPAPVLTSAHAPRGTPGALLSSYRRTRHGWVPALCRMCVRRFGRGRTSCRHLRAQRLTPVLTAVARAVRYVDVALAAASPARSGRDSPRTGRSSHRRRHCWNGARRRCEPSSEASLRASSASIAFRPVLRQREDLRDVVLEHRSAVRGTSRVLTLVRARDAAGHRRGRALRRACLRFLGARPAGTEWVSSRDEPERLAADDRQGDRRSTRASTPPCTRSGCELS